MRAQRVPLRVDLIQGLLNLLLVLLGLVLRFLQLVNASSQLAYYLLQLAEGLRNHVLFVFFLKDDVFELVELLDEGPGVLDEFDLADDLILLLLGCGGDLELSFELTHALLNQVDLVVGLVDLLLSLSLLVLGVGDLAIQHLHLGIDGFPLSILFFDLVK